MKMRWIIIVGLFFAGMHGVYASPIGFDGTPFRKVRSDAPQITMTKQVEETNTFKSKYKPSELIIANHDTDRENSLCECSSVSIAPGTVQSKIRLNKELVRESNRVGRKFCKISFNMIGLAAEYVLTFDKKKNDTLKRFNAIGVQIKATVPRVQYVFFTDQQKYVFDYVGVTNEWQEIIIPFASFTGFECDSADTIKGFKFVVPGSDEAIDQELCINNVILYDYEKDDIARLQSFTEQFRFVPPQNAIEVFYQKRSSL